MSSESDGDVADTIACTKKRKLSELNRDDDEIKYKPFSKKGYKRNYPDISNGNEFPVYVESINRDDNIGNKNPLYLSKIFKQVKGIIENRRINANKVMLVFKQAVTANDFLSHKCLTENNMRAYIPASSVERVGVVRYIPIEASNEELFNKLSSESEIIAVRRFRKKIGDVLTPLSTISVTFSGTSLPQYLDNWRYRVWQYVPPLMQCFKCMKFRHSAKVCRNEQVCSKCTGSHSYKECESDILKCINCGGAHLAISKLCPFKMSLIEKHL